VNPRLKEAGPRPSDPIRRSVLKPFTDDPYEDVEVNGPAFKRTATPPSRQPDHQLADASAEEETEDEGILVSPVADRNHNERVQVPQSPDIQHK
jgi:hypothetical protein